MLACSSAARYRYLVLHYTLPSGYLLGTLGMCSAELHPAALSSVFHCQSESQSSPYFSGVRFLLHQNRDLKGHRSISDPSRAVLELHVTRPGLVPPASRCLVGRAGSLPAPKTLALTLARRPSFSSAQIDSAHVSRSLHSPRP
ncbi:hypothetical protein M441DRAFT_328610 [Trichoderma asperellum CBS 433.97]|uniref:Uncharacterized protein n=1 Tax=Trichoderma asperellum (strain ATCC 204424 / CBS 433.97 / NBRC 101777) TaxID=1042311 RepID=A0A2T3YSD2_TRIA4|nr:hypothetical protein M441DRAFT_328610 [Trichoderma asperellum CBS 433.97]PTB35475.1 hypothetical protein M441DRAFT_328610 [Trichoderma asperellum CBS 433.97]